LNYFSVTSLFVKGNETIFAIPFGCWPGFICLSEENLCGFQSAGTAKKSQNPEKQKEVVRERS